MILTYELKGQGTAKDPYRRVTQLWTKQGELVAEYDPVESDTGEASWFKEPQNGYEKN